MLCMSDSQFQATQWWQTGVIYQIYPRSFQDTNGDGVGDLRGIAARLDYLVGLGVDAIWISPFYPSPMADFGYDVADYTNVDPIFGTLEDFDDLLQKAHAKGLHVILDFVPNHTSDVHPWFLESRSSRNNEKRDWYLWHDAQIPGDDWQPAKYRVPNNWMSHFGGPAWAWDEHTEQFYLHSFLKEQPDLNWRNPKVREAMYQAMRFWLDRGVDGFRMDVLWLLIKDKHFRSNPPHEQDSIEENDEHRYVVVHNADQPETLEIVSEMRALLDSYPDTLMPAPKKSPGPVEEVAAESPDLSPSHRVLIGEIYLPLKKLVRYYGVPHTMGAPERPGTGLDGAETRLEGANLPFNFHLIHAPWRADAIAAVIQRYEDVLPPGAWPNYVLGNHDQKRLASRLGAQQARVAAMLLLTLRGTPTLYYGDELGMEDIPISPDQVKDPAERNEPGLGKGRDPERSPMLWVDAPNAGFTPPGAEPWLPILKDYATRNAATQSKDKRSIFTLYRRLLHLRHLHDTLQAGGITEIAVEGTLLRYRRTGIEGGHSSDFQVLLNLGTEVLKTKCAPGTIVLTTILDGEGSRVGGEEGSPAEVTVEGGEGLLIALD